MNTWAAFAMGEANRGKELMVFDWDKAARLIKERKPKCASAGLRSDWQYTGGTIYEGGKPVMDDKEFYDKYPCVHRAEDGACAACAYMCDCGWPEDCKLREEALKDGSTTD